MNNVSKSNKICVLQENIDKWSVLKSLTKNEDLDEPVALFNIDCIVKRHVDWKNVFPRITPYYAVKCNDSLHILKTLAALDVNFDCATSNEIDLIISLGIDVNRIIYANPKKSISHLKHAEKVNVDLTTFDNEAELHKIKEYHPKAQLLIRIKCDDPNLEIQFGKKFGCHHEEAPTLLKTAKKLGLEVIGVCFHVGTGGNNPPVFGMAIKYAKQVFDVAKKIGYNFSILDIGGGFQGDNDYTLDEVANVINTSLDKYFGDPSVKVISEPGRYYVASAVTVACKIVSKEAVRHNENLNANIHNKYFVNDGMFGSFNCVLFNRVQAKPSLKPYGKDTEKLYSSSVWGPTCAALDQISFDVQLPDLEVGQWLYYENMGAYSRVLSTNFNGFPPIKEYYVISKSISNIIKNKDTFFSDDFSTK